MLQLSQVIVSAILFSSDIWHVCGREMTVVWYVWVTVLWHVCGGEMTVVWYVWVTVLWHVCGGEMMVLWYVSGGEMTAYDGEGMCPKIKAHYIWDGILLLAVSVSQARTQIALCTSYLSCLGYSYSLLFSPSNAFNAAVTSVIVMHL